MTVAGLASNVGFDRRSITFAVLKRRLKVSLTKHIPVMESVKCTTGLHKKWART